MTTAVETGAGRRPGAGAVLRWELTKLQGQARGRLGLGVCALAPFVLVVGLAVQSSTPSDTPFGRWVNESGFAVPLVVLGFVGQWALPLLVAVVAGDVFSAEDHLGTWKTVLTRSVSRRSVFIGKVLAAAAWTVAVVVTLAVASCAAGALVGHQPLIALTGQPVAAGRASALVAASWASALPPSMAYAAMGVLASVAGRTSAVGIGAPVVAGLLLQLLTLVNGPEAILLATPAGSLAAWHGLWTEPVYAGQVWLGVGVAAAWAAVATAVAWAMFTRRDVRVA